MTQTATHKLGEYMKGYKPVKMKPSISLSSDELPEIRQWQPGNTYRILLTVRQTSMGVGDPFGDKPKDGKDHVSGSFEILNAKALNNQPKQPQNGQSRNKSAMMKALSKKAQY